jgi:ribosome maturation factor RimP
MDREAITRRIEALALPLVERAGLELFAVHYRSEQGRMVVRLIVDLPDGGVTLDALADLSRQVGHQLEVEDAVPGRYHLECTSPGVERPLLRPHHFARAVGTRVRVRTTDAWGPRRRLRGTLVAADEDGVTVVDDEAGSLRVPFDAITDARTEFDAAEALAGHSRR